jgi:hypothetical protein
VIVGCSSGGLGYSTQFEDASVPLAVSLALPTLVAAVFGAFLWLRKNPPSMTCRPAQ